MENVDVAVFKEILETVGVLDWLSEVLGVSRDEAVRFAKLNNLDSLIDYFTRTERSAA